MPPAIIILSAPQAGSNLRLFLAGGGGNENLNTFINDKYCHSFSGKILF